MKTACFIIAAFSLFGCESSQEMFKSREGQQVSSTGVRCEMTYRTGSNKKTKICKTTEQMEADRKEAERTMEKNQRKTGILNGN